MNLKKYFFSLLLLASTLLTASAQIVDYDYQFKIKGASDTVYLAYYFGDKLYYSDTTTSNAAGEFRFKKNREIMPGKFAVVFPGQTYFEVVINEPSFKMESDTSDIVGKMVVTGSVENKLFYDYIKYLNQKKSEIQPLQEAFQKEEKEKKKEEIREKMIAVDKAVKDYQKDIAENKTNTLFGQIVALSVDIDVPDAPKNEQGVIDSSFQYYYYRDHYFDRVNLKNEAIVRCPSFNNKLKEYFNKVVLQHPDTINKMADALIAKTNPEGDLFKYIVNYVMNNFNKSKIMGMDAVFYHMGKNYYMSGKAYWADSATVAKIEERVTAIQYILIGGQAPQLNLFDTTGKKRVALSAVNAEYTILYFWSPTCGHCKKSTPKLQKIYDKLKPFGVEVYAVGTELETDKWKEFIKEHKHTWLDVSDTPERPDPFRTYYDIYATPKVFLLDKNKKIIAKELGVEQLGDILKQKLKQPDIDFGIAPEDKGDDTAH